MDMEKKMAAACFITNNGKVLRAINILRTKYNKLKSIGLALDIENHELVDCVNYLQVQEYIHLRDSLSKESKSLADAQFDELEAKLTGKGIQLLAGKCTDPCVEI